MRYFVILFFWIFITGTDATAQESRDYGDAGITREIDLAIRDGNMDLAWNRFISKLVHSRNDVPTQFILFDKGIEICLIENQPQLADELFLTAKSIGLLKDRNWRTHGFLMKAEIQFNLGNFSIMDSMHDKVTASLNAETKEVDLSNLFAQRAIFAMITHQHAAANEYIEAVLFDTADDETSRSRAIALMVLALMIEEQGKQDSLIELNLRLSRKIFERNNNTIGFYALLSRFMQIDSGQSIRSVNDIILKEVQKGDRFESNWIKSVALTAHGEVHRRQAEFKLAVDLLQQSDEHRDLANAEAQAREVDWLRIWLQYYRFSPEVFIKSFPLYWLIVTMLLIVLMLVLILRIRTQRIINEKLLESVEKSRLAEQAADHASKLKSQFVSNVSHEIKAPMSGLVGMTSILEELIRDPAQRKYLTTIRECSRNLLVLMNDLLDLGRIDADKLEIELAPFAVRETIDYCEQIIRVRTEEKGLNLIVQTSPDLPGILISDATRLSQILLNLLNNAVQFTTRGSIQLKVDFKTSVGRGGILEVIVSDTGTGIEPDRLPTVFEPFNQTSPPDEANGTGSGLGLAISKRLTDHMGGKLTVQSEFGKGTTFTLSLPVQLPKE